MKTIVIALGLIIAIAAAVNGGSGKADSAGPKMARRTVTQQHTGEGMGMQSGDSGSGNMFKFSLATAAGSPMRIRTRYYAKSTDAESKVSLRVTMASIVEFEEKSATFDGYTPGVDTLVKELKFQNSWRAIADPEVTTDSDGAKQYKYMVAYPNPDAPSGDVFRMTLRFCEGEYIVDQTSYDPNQIKIDVGIYNWSFANSSHYLALQARTQSRAMRQFRHGTTNGECAAESGQNRAAFSWVNQASADGQLGDLVKHGNESNCDPDAADPEAETGETAQQWFFSFGVKGPKAIVWDPIIETSPASSLVASLALLVAALLTIF